MKTYLQISLLFFFVSSLFIGCSSEDDAFSTMPIENCPALSLGDADNSYLSSHPYGIESINISGNCLNIDVAFSGGCEDHTFDLWWNEEYETELLDNEKTVKAVLSLIHNNNGDYCEARIKGSYSFNINEIRHADFSEVAIEIFNTDSSFVYQY